MVHNPPCFGSRLYYYGSVASCVPLPPSYIQLMGIYFYFTDYTHTHTHTHTQHANTKFCTVCGLFLYDYSLICSLFNEAVSISDNNVQ